MPSSDVIMFELHVDRIRNDSNEVASLARTLAAGNIYPENYQEFDLRQSEQNLRDAADRLSSIRARLEMHRTQDEMI